MSYSVSLRGKTLEEPVGEFLKTHYADLDIDSVFGFPNYPCKLYGGRNFYVNPYKHRVRVAEISDDDLTWLRDRDITLRLPLTNHFAPRDEFEAAKPFLDKFYMRGTSLIVTNDDLARWLQVEYPLFNVEASVIKGIDTVGKIIKYFEIYDSIVPAFEVHEDLDLLAAIPQKHRIRLFANVSCEKTCPARLCYLYFSKVNKNPTDDSTLGPPCSQPIIPRAGEGMVNYPVERYEKMGFTRFKLLRAKLDNPHQAY